MQCIDLGHDKQKCLDLPSKNQKVKYSLGILSNFETHVAKTEKNRLFSQC